MQSTEDGSESAAHLSSKEYGRTVCTVTAEGLLFLVGMGSETQLG